MRILIINSVCGIGSTGRICLNLAKQYENEGHIVRIAFGRDQNFPADAERFAYPIDEKFEFWLHALRTRLFDGHGLGSRHKTNDLLKWMDDYSPELIWLHNIHGYYINYELLFDWIKRHPDIKIRWTLHDCWAFTGHCAYFSAVVCYRWISGCHGNCPNKLKYPASILLSKSAANYIKKKAAFSGVRNMQLIVPSNWLKELVEQSFLSEYPIEVQYNQIDPGFVRTKSELRKKLGLTDKTIILGVANIWTENKGLKDFIKLSKLIGRDQHIVLVGHIRKKPRDMPDNITCIAPSLSVRELAEFYSIADWFVNPSLEETFGMTSVEAALCGARVIVYKNTACEEIAAIYGGIAVEQNAEAIYKIIQSV